MTLYLLTMNVLCVDKSIYPCLVEILVGNIKIYLYFISFAGIAMEQVVQILHYSNVIMSAMASQITSASIVYSTVCSGADQRKHQGFASLAFVRGIHRWLVDSPRKGQVTWKMFPFDDVIMLETTLVSCCVRFRTYHSVLCKVTVSWEPNNQ